MTIENWKETYNLSVAIFHTYRPDEKKHKNKYFKIEVGNQIIHVSNGEIIMIQDSILI